MDDTDLEVTDLDTTEDAGTQETRTPDEGVAPEAAPDDDGAPDDSPGREAKKYRIRLREAEAERDALAATVEALQRDAVERIAQAAELKPAALWASGAQLADMLTEAGVVDPAAVQTAITAARDALGVPPPRSGLYVPREGNSPRPQRVTGMDAMVNTVMGRSEG